MLYPVTCTKNMVAFLHRTSWNHVQIIPRRSRITKSLCLRKSSPRLFYHSSKRDSCILSKLIEAQSRNYNDVLTCLCGRRYMSDMKNDDIVRTWLNEIKDDFEKGKDSKQLSGENNEITETVQEKLVSDRVNDKNLDKDDNKDVKISDNDSVNTNTSYSGLSEGVSDVHGFTVDEMIEIVKQAHSNETKGSSIADERNNENVVESSSSESDDNSDSSSSSESDDDLEEKTKKIEKESEKDLSDRDLGLDDSDIKLASDNLKDELTNVLHERKPKQFRTMKDRFKNASEFVKSEIEDFVNIDFEEPEEEVRQWEPPVPLTHGKTGVFDIEDLVKVLEANRARDVVVIKIPDETDFASYMVIVSAMSYRHIRAMTAEVKWIYKRRKHPKDNTIKIEGEDTKDWFALDLGNIVLHIFTPETRELYDLETLWTVGPQFDPKCQEEVKAQVFSLSDLPWLDELDQSDISPTTPISQSTSEDIKR